MGAAGVAHAESERSELSWYRRHRSTREERAKARAEAIGEEEEATRGPAGIRAIRRGPRQSGTPRREGGQEEVAVA